MPRVRRPHDIINRKSLVCRLDEAMGRSAYRPELRGEVLGLFKQAHSKGWNEARRRFEEEDTRGAELVGVNSYLIDQIVRTVYDVAAQHIYPVDFQTKSKMISVTANGGYGRQKLAPHSDIDLMFLLPHGPVPQARQVIEFILYMLWDMGLKVGHSTRTVDEALHMAKDDTTIRTALLDTRWLRGNEDLCETFKTRFFEEIAAKTGPQFVELKLAERDRRHKRMGNTRYVLEPNVKEGKGGLRDLQTLYWIVKYLYRVDQMGDLVKRGVLTPQDHRRHVKTADFLWTVRCHLHYLAGRPEEHLTFNVQAEIGKRMGYRDQPGRRGVERFMKHYFLVAKDVGDLTRVLCAVLEESQAKKRFHLPFSIFLKQDIVGFCMEGDRLDVDSEDSFRQEPAKLIRLFYKAQKHRLDIHPHALRLVSQNLSRINKKIRNDPESNRLFLEMITDLPDPEVALTRLNESGVLGRFIPDFGRVVAQMQYDMYHVYTVDEHSIRAIGILRRIEEGSLAEAYPLVTAVIKEIQARRVLYAAVFFHDIAKGRGGDHSKLGAEVAKKLGPRLGLEDWETEIASWLVLEHLSMSQIAFRRDVNDPKTVADFVELVRSPKRLRLLMVLTVVDISAVGPGVWTSWKAVLIRELFHSALAMMMGGLPEGRQGARVERTHQALTGRLQGWEKSEIEWCLSLGTSSYWLAFDTETLVRHANMVREAEKKQLRLHIETHADPERAATELVIYAPDNLGLFAQIAGGVAMGGDTILNAKIATLSNGMALDTFLIQNISGSAVEDEACLRKLWTAIEDSLSGTRFPEHELERGRKNKIPSRTQVFKVQPQVIFDNKASHTHTVIEVNGRDRPELLYDITRALTQLGLQISSAHVSTYGELAVDVFYVKNAHGQKIENKEKLKHIRAAILEVTHIVSPLLAV